MSKTRQEWTLPAQLGQLKIGQGGNGLLQLRRPFTRLWDRIE